MQRGVFFLRTEFKAAREPIPVHSASCAERFLKPQLTMEHPKFTINRGSASKESQAMPGVKRSHDGVEKEIESNASPFMLMFETFRDELDEHHDRRERIIKASRDITAASKKM